MILLRVLMLLVLFFFNDTATTEIYTLSLHDALPIYRYFLFVRFDDLGIVRSHGGGGYNDVRAFDVGAFVTLIEGRAEILEALGDRGRLGVRAGHGIAESQEHFSDTAHTDAANTDQVNPLKIAERAHHALALCRFPCTCAASSMRFTMSRAAKGRASPRAAVDSFSISWGWLRREKISPVRLSAVSSASEIRRPEPARVLYCDMRKWCIAEAHENRWTLP